MSSSRTIASFALARRDAVVTWEDQQRINTFNSLNTRLHELDDALRGKLPHNTLLPAEAQAFVHAPKSTVEALLEERRVATAAEAEALVSERGRVDADLAALKAALYGKFGDAINLEED
eukprot:SM000083S22776  [mRNA]  locus=s83:462812:463450:+ [translate_table: standard]